MNEAFVASHTYTYSSLFSKELWLKPAMH